MSIKDSLDNLKTTVQQANNMIKATEKTINDTMDSLMKNASPDELQIVQKHIISVKSLLVKAKKGENVDVDISNIAKSINNGRRD